MTRAEEAGVVHAGLQVALHRLADPAVLVEHLDAEALDLGARRVGGGRDVGEEEVVDDARGPGDQRGLEGELAEGQPGGQQRGGSSRGVKVRRAGLSMALSVACTADSA